MTPQTPTILRQWTPRKPGRRYGRLWNWLRWVPVVAVALLTLAGLFFPRAPQLPAGTITSPLADLTVTVSNPLWYGMDAQNLLVLRLERGRDGGNMTIPLTLTNTTPGLQIYDLQGNPQPNSFSLEIPAEKNYAASYRLGLERARGAIQQAELVLSMPGDAGDTLRLPVRVPVEGWANFAARWVLSWFGTSYGVILSLLVFLYTAWGDRKNSREQRRRDAAAAELAQVETLCLSDPCAAIARFQRLEEQYRDMLNDTELARRAQDVKQQLGECTGLCIESASEALLQGETAQESALRILRNLDWLYQQQWFDRSDHAHPNISHADQQNAVQAWTRYLDGTDPTISRETLQTTWNAWDVQAKELIVYALPDLLKHNPQALQVFGNDANLRRLLRDKRVRNLDPQLESLAIRPDGTSSQLPESLRVLDDRRLNDWINRLAPPLRNNVALAQAGNFPGSSAVTLRSERTLVWISRDGFEARLAGWLAAQHLRDLPRRPAFPLLLPLSADDLRAVLQHETLLLEQLACHAAEQWLVLLARQPQLYLDLPQDDQRLLARLIVYADGGVGNWQVHWQALLHDLDAAPQPRPGGEPAAPEHRANSRRLLFERVRRCSPPPGSPPMQPAAAEVRRWFTLHPAGYQKTCLIVMLDEHARDSDAMQLISLLRRQSSGLRQAGLRVLALLPAATLDEISPAPLERLNWSDEELLTTLKGWVKMLQEHTLPGAQPVQDYADLDALFAGLDMLEIHAATGLLPKNLLVQWSEGSLGRLIELTEGAVEAHLNAAQGTDDGRLTAADLQAVGIALGEEDSHDT